ncbi:charged multivesicular body protein 1b-like [Symsagittifera roscoffensis]|uniref:charged multivesicular body protein 1b-like n=1 Tax=Symsagittifera roscoffensis TaxID=84072 RepID=UPI00307B490A
MPKLDDLAINLKMLTKTLEREAKRSKQSQTQQRSKLKKAIEQNNMEGAKIYAENAIRNKNEELNYLKLASRIDAVAARVNSAAKMGALTKNMSGVTKALDSCMKQFSLDKVQNLMEKFEGQFENLDVQASSMDQAMSNTVTTFTPEDQVRGLMQEVASEAGLELNTQIQVAPSAASAQSEEQEELSRRLAALRETHQ